MGRRKLYCSRNCGAKANRTLDEHDQLISELWSRFSGVAATNPNAWSQVALSAEEIRIVTPKNRIIGSPYRKVMNSNNQVDMAAALIICSVEKATQLGIAKDRWVFPISGTDCHEHYYISNRFSFSDTPAVRLGGAMACDLADVSLNDISLVDLYSCFPSAVQLGAQSLNLSLNQQLTITGGLSFAGGPWNNYVMHAVATVVGELRARPGEKGLVWGNGGYATKHAFGVYSTTPPTNGFKHAYPQDQIDALPRRTVVDIGTSEGPATIEGYTVMHDRDGHPERAIAPCLLPNGNRAWGISDDADTVNAMCEGEWVGRAVRLDATGTLLIK
jgi:acetyl-CoA C-acetyltransferase